MATTQKKLKLRTMNPHIVCLLCAGYFVEATTIVECLHTFCKSCIVRYFQLHKHCPTCGILVSETEPLSKLKLDRTMQDIMAMLLPHMVPDETKREKEFHDKITSQQRKNDEERLPRTQKPDFDLTTTNNFRTDEQINLCLEMDRSNETLIDGVELAELHNKYVRCSLKVRILHIKKLISKFYELPSDGYQLKIKCNGTYLVDNEHLKQVYIIHWKRKPVPMILHYEFIKTKQAPVEDEVKEILHELLNSIEKNENHLKSTAIEKSNDSIDCAISTTFAEAGLSIPASKSNNDGIVTRLCRSPERFTLEQELMEHDSALEKVLNSENKCDEISDDLCAYNEDEEYCSSEEETVVLEDNVDGQYAGSHSCCVLESTKMETDVNVSCRSANGVRTTIKVDKNKLFTSPKFNAKLLEVIRQCSLPSLTKDVTTPENDIGDVTSNTVIPSTVVGSGVKVLERQAVCNKF